MSDGPFCAHLNVEYAPIKNDNGSLSEHWQCKDCKFSFLPNIAGEFAAQTAAAPVLQATPLAGDGEELPDDYRPSKSHLSNSEVRSTGMLCGGAVANIAR